MSDSYWCIVWVIEFTGLNPMWLETQTDGLVACGVLFTLHMFPHGFAGIRSVCHGREPDVIKWQLLLIPPSTIVGDVLLFGVNFQPRQGTDQGVWLLSLQ